MPDPRRRWARLLDFGAASPRDANATLARSGVIGVMAFASAVGRMNPLAVLAVALVACTLHAIVVRTRPAMIRDVIAFGTVVVGTVVGFDRAAVSWTVGILMVLEGLSLNRGVSALFGKSPRRTT